MKAVYVGSRWADLLANNPGKRDCYALVARDTDNLECFCSHMILLVQRIAFLRQFYFSLFKIKIARYCQCDLKKVL